jgi:DnaJ family protein A protein 5
MLKSDKLVAESCCKLQGPDFSPFHNLKESASSNHDADYAPREVLERRLDQENPSTQILMDSVDNISQGLSAARLNETSSSTTAKVGKAKQKRAKKARLAEEKIQLTECTICNASFSSRNKLFSHLKLHR